MELPGLVIDARQRVRHAAARSPDPDVLARWGLAAMLVAAGLHKLADPVAWAAYVADWLAPWLIVSPVEFMLVNGYLEVGFAALLFSDRHTAFAAGVAAVSLTATVGYLTIVWATTGAFGDVIARDIGLAGLAWAVLVSALRRDPTGHGTSEGSDL